jgi:hypothetical protein
MAQVVEHLPTKQKALSSNPITEKKKKVLQNKGKMGTCGSCLQS